MPYYPFAPENDAIYRLARGSNVAVFNDRTDPDFVGMIDEISGLDSPEIREAADDMTQADGGLHGDFYYGRRPIIINGLSYGHSTVLQRNARLDKIERASAAMRSDATLSWKPFLRKENFARNPAFNVDTSLWTAASTTNMINSGATLSHSTSQGTVGRTANRSAQVVTTGSSDLQGIVQASIPGPFKQGTSYRLSIYVMGSAGGEVVNVRVGNGAANDAPQSANTTLTTGWTRIGVTWTPTANRATADLAVRHTNRATLEAPTGVTATPSISGGTLADGIYYYKVVAVNANGTTVGSVEAQATLLGGLGSGSVTVAWTAVPGATTYRVYRGTATNAQNVYYTDNASPFVDTGAAGTAGTVPASNTAYVGATFFVDGAMVVEGTTDPTYFDGDTDGHHWQGSPDSSASGDFIEMFTTVRRQQPIRFSGPWVKSFQVPLVSEYAPLFSVAQIVRSGLASGSTHVIENRGSGRSHPIIRIFGVGTNPYVTNTTTGEVVKTTGVTLSTVNDYIEIDTLNHTAVLNGAAANGNIDFAGSSAIWPTLVMGNNSFVLTNGGTMTVTYRDTWQNGS